MSLGKKLRFEVFKRDSFKCQYCGRSAPDVILHVDHILPVSEGGEDDLINLVTSCRDCNLGKSNRKLSDDAVIQQQRQQLEELQERREQLEMMMEWQRGLIDLEAQAVEELADLWHELAPGYSLNEHGMDILRGMVGKFEIAEIAEAMRISAQQYLVTDSDGTLTKDSVEKAWGKVGGICFNRRRAREHPELAQLPYIAGIIRKRFSYYDQRRAYSLMTRVINAGVADAEQIEQAACTAPNWSSWRGTLECWLDSEKQQ